MEAVMVVWVKTTTKINDILLQSAWLNRKRRYRRFLLHRRLGVEEDSQRHTPSEWFDGLFMLGILYLQCSIRAIGMEHAMSGFYGVWLWYLS